MALDLYVQTYWPPSTPITQDKMEHLEQGVYDNRMALREHDTTLSGLDNKIRNEVQMQTSSMSQQAQQGQEAKTAIVTATTEHHPPYNSLNARLDFIQDSLGNYTNLQTGQPTPTYNANNTVASAITNLQNALGYNVDPLTEETTPAFSNLSPVSASVKSLSEAVTTIRTELNNARINNTTHIDYGSLTNHLNEIDSFAKGLESSINTINESAGLEANGEESTLARRIQQLQLLQSEVDAARRAVQEGQPIDTLAKRFADIDTALSVLKAGISNLADTKVAYADIIDDLIHTDANKPLSAGKGKELKDTIGGSYSTTNTVASGITAAQNAAESNAAAYADEHKVDKTNVYNALDYVPAQDATDDKVLDARQGKALNDRLVATETEIAAAHRDLGLDEHEEVIVDSLNKRFVDAEGAIGDLNTEVINARKSSVVRTPGENEGDPDTDTAYASLDARLEAIELHAAAVRTDVNTVANELNMYTAATHTIVGQNSRLDQMESNLVEMANEIGMLQDGEAVQNMTNAISGATTRIDGIEAEIEAAHRTGLVDGNEEPVEDSLDNRFDDIEGRATALENAVTALDSDVDTIESNLSAARAIADANAAAISHAVGAGGANDKGGLTQRVQSVENAATTIISVVNFEALEANAANSTKDYLVGPDDSNLYKYYRIIETSPNTYEKVLISGGGSGSGNSSGAFAASLEDITNPDINTDYFVGNNNDGYFHYRFIEQANSVALRPVLITPINYYQIETREIPGQNGEESTTVLDLYKFNTERTQSSITENDYGNIIGTVTLPKGGGSAGAGRIYVKIPAGQAQYISYQDLLNNGLTLGFSYTCYSIIGENEYDYINASYTLETEDGRLIKHEDSKVALDYSGYRNNVINIQTDNLAEYCHKNETTKFILRLEVPDSDITPRTITVSVTAVELKLSSEFNDQKTQYNTDLVQIDYNFIGIQNQDTRFEILYGQGDNLTNITSQVSNNLALSRLTIPATVFTGSTGVYNVRIRASQVINGETLYTNSLNYQLGLIEPNSTDILLFGGMSLEEQTVEQYRTITLPYYLYLPSNITTANVHYTVYQIFYNDQHEVTSSVRIPGLERPADLLGTGAHSYMMRISSMVAQTEYYQIILTCEDASLTFNIKVNMAAEQINIETQNLKFDFKPEQYSNNASLEERLWHYESGGIRYSMRIPENAHFDWRTGGWIVDDNNVPCFCVKAGSKVEFVQQTIGQNDISPLTLFWDGMETNGSDFKCTFKIDNVKTPNAPFLTSLDTVPNTMINYGKLILSDKQDVEDEDTLLYNYLRVKYLYTQTINNKGKVVKESIGTTVLNDSVNQIDGPFSAQLTEAKRAAAEAKAAKKNTDKIKDYINNIFTIVNYARVTAHKEALLNILSGNMVGSNIDYTTIQDTILDYLQNVEHATAVYNTLIALENDITSSVYEYRQIEPENLDAILNGFVVEGKEGKDGIIAMLEFTFETDIREGGAFLSQTISVEPESTNTFTGTATFLVNVDDDKTYEVTMTNDSGTYTDIVSIQDASNTTTTAYGLELNALGSNIYLPSGKVSYAHSEGDTIEFEYNINAPLASKINSSIIIYEDGVPSAAKLYTISNNVSNSSVFKQIAPGSLTIGSDECDVYIYKMRLYDHALTDKQILGNFYADGLTVDEMIARHDRNKNLIKNNIDELTPQLVAQECPDLRVIMIEAPSLTGGKNSFIKNTKIRCIYKNGRPEDNWVALNAYHAGQGTSSDNYGASARNLDIIFGFDGEDTLIIPKPQKNNYQFDPQYKSILVTGLDHDTSNDILSLEDIVDLINNAGGEVTRELINNPSVQDTKEFTVDNLTIHTGGTGMTNLSDTSIPNNWFNIKLNVASSENTNNAYLQKRFDRYLWEYVYQNHPARKHDSRIKNDMEFFNCVIFIKETDTPKEFVNDNGPPDTRRWHFYGIGNIGDSKKTDKSRVNIPGDPYEFAVEITDNGLLLSGFSSGVFYTSEASKVRSQTPRNQAGGNADIPEAIFAQESHVCTSGEYTVNNGTYSFSITPVANTMYFVPIENNAYRRFIYLNNAWIEVGEPISFARTNYGIKYPVSKAEWEISLNEYHDGLYNFGGKGWDKSFEFRYDITTKDGETIARTDLEEKLNDMHQSVNKEAFANMYSYIVTVPNNSFVSQVENWFVKDALPYWYLFTERYTMIDSRAKNTFYHYGKFYITEAEASGARIAELNDIKNNHLAEYISVNHIEDYKTATAEDIANAELDYQIATATFLYENANCFEIDNVKAGLNNGYRFELWGYDMDTALGINNNGQMVFSAGIEDTDKDVSGWIYNEAESVIWARVRENMYNELSALYVKLKEKCFNAENLIAEFDALQAQFPEELWRADFERKYYRPFRDANETTYLSDMANGRKKYQRRQFERDMAIYINSKYQRNGSYLENDLISFRPQFTWTTGRDTRIIIKPYSTMYINFALGNQDNSGGQMTDRQEIFKRVERGEEFIINAADFIHDYNNIQCIIYNASRIMYLDGLGNFECKQFILGAAKKLSVLKLGSETYVNRSMSDINNLGLSTGLPLLEELDLTNIQFGTINNGNWISTPPATFALENFPLLKRFNAKGCNINSFTFKDGGMLEHIIFPSGLTSIQFRNLYNLIDHEEDGEIIPAVELDGTANLISYYSLNSYPSSYQIVHNMLNNSSNRITQLYLNDIDWTIGNISELQPLVDLHTRLQDNVFLQGTIHITGTWSEPERDTYLRRWPNLIFDTSLGTQKIKYIITYKYDDYYDSDNNLIEGKIIDTKYIDQGTIIPDIYYEGDIELPQRYPTARYSYVFGRLEYGNYIPNSGWRSNNSEPNDYYTVMPEARNNMTILTHFTPTARKYPVKWYMKRNDPTSIVKTSIAVDYNSGEDLEIPTVPEIHAAGQNTLEIEFEGDIANYSIFSGWEKLPININPTANDTSFDIYATWNTGSIALGELFADTTNITPLQLAVFSKMSPTQKSNYTKNKIDAGKRMTLNLGYDSIEPGQDLIEGVIRFDLNSAQRPIKTNIQPMRANDNAFTIMIDYSFNPNTVYNSTDTVGILMSCYYENASTNVVNGFALYNNLKTNATGPRVGFGDMFSSNNYSIAVGGLGTTNYEARNVVVLRHPLNSRTLYVYYGLANGDHINSIVNVGTLTWDNAPSDSPAFINFGQLTDSTDNVYDGKKQTIKKAGCTIYQAKYWHKDLGAGECRRLAIWPHEKMVYGITNISNNITTSGTPKDETSSPSIGLTSLTNSSHGLLTEDTIATGWGNSTYNSILNNKVILSLPIEMQAIIGKPVITYLPLVTQEDAFGGISKELAGSPLTQRNYLYFPSIANLDNTFNAYEIEITNSSHENGMFPWINSGGITVYEYNPTASGPTARGRWYIVDDETRQKYRNLRFSQIALLTGNIRIFKENEFNLSANSSTTIATEISTTGEIRIGDIFIDLSGNTYMYVSNSDIMTRGAQVQPATGIFVDSEGGWIKANGFWTRSMMVPDQFQQYSTNHFIYCSQIGAIYPSYSVNSAAPSVGLGLNYSLSI